MAGPADFFSDLETPAPQAIPPEVKRVPVTKNDPAAFFQEMDTSAAPPDRQYGYGETAALHGLHGMTAGFDDELTGIGALSGANRPTLNPVDLMYGLARLGFGKLTDDGGALEDYTKARDAKRKELEESQRQNPITAIGSDVAGSMVLPGGAYLKGATTLGRLGRGAAVSGLHGTARGAGEAQELENVPGSAITGGVLGATIGAPLNAVLGPRAASVNQQALKDIGDKYGVQLPYYMVSESPLVQFMGKGFDQLPFVGESASRAAKKAKEGVQGIRDDLVEGPTGTTIPTEARKIGSQAATDAQSAFRQARMQVDELNYDAVRNAMTNPGAKAPPTNMQTEIADQFHRLQQYGGTPGNILNRAIAASETAIDRGGLTYGALKDLRTDLYRNWKTMEGRGGIDFADYAKLIGAITKDMEGVVRQAGGPNAVRLWEKANAQHGIGKDLAKEIATAVGRGQGDTAAADAIFRNLSATRPNIGAVNTLRNTMRPDEWAKVQASVVGRLGADDAGNFSMQKFISENNKLADASRDALFGRAGTPTRDAYDAVLKLGSAIQNVERFANTSKTAPMLLGAGAVLQVYEDIRSKSPFQHAGELGAGVILASILSRPATARSATNFAKAMDKYLHTPAMWTAGQVPKAVEVAARNFAISVANSGGLDKDKMVNAFTAPTPLWER